MNDKYYYNKTIQHIIDAQRASDGGKGIMALPENWASAAGYAAKPVLIRKALQIIDSHPRMGINYYVLSEDDQNGYPSILVYFEFKVDGKRCQVSFHNPSNPETFQTLGKWVGKGRPTRWNKLDVGSRQACFEVLERSYNR